MCEGNCRATWTRFKELEGSGGPRAVREGRLISAGWAWCYQNNGKALLGNRREYCAWADEPGHIYFAPVDRLSARLLSDFRERFAKTQEAERNADDSLLEEPRDGGEDGTAPDDVLTEHECSALGGSFSSDDSTCIWFG